MSEYKNFPKDFLKRTQENLNNYKGGFEVTNLINSCLGLIIIPNELMIDKFPPDELLGDDRKYGICKRNILTNSSNDYHLTAIVKGIRNGLAHGNIKQKTEDGEISGIKITNIYHDKTKLSVLFTIDEFKAFALAISSELLKTKRLK